VQRNFQEISQKKKRKSKSKRKASRNQRGCSLAVIVKEVVIEEEDGEGRRSPTALNLFLLPLQWLERIQWRHC